MLLIHLTGSVFNLLLLTMWWWCHHAWNLLCCFVVLRLPITETVYLCSTTSSSCWTLKSRFASLICTSKNILSNIYHKILLFIIKMVINSFLFCFLSSNYLNKDITTVINITKAELLKVLNHERLSKNVLGNRAHTNNWSSVSFWWCSSPVTSQLTSCWAVTDTPITSLHTLLLGEHAAQ